MRKPANYSETSFSCFCDEVFHSFPIDASPYSFLISLFIKKTKASSSFLKVRYRYSLFPCFPFITKGMINITQPTKKIMLTAKLNMSWFSKLDAIKNPAHKRKRIHPQRWNFVSLFRSSDNISIASYSLVIRSKIL